MGIVNQCAPTVQIPRQMQHRPDDRAPANGFVEGLIKPRAPWRGRHQTNKLPLPCDSDEIALGPNGLRLKPSEDIWPFFCAAFR